MKPISFIFGALSCSLLSACSSDDNSTSYDESYVQFYNASISSKSTHLTLIKNDEETSLGSAPYGDVISSYEATPGSYDYSITYTDESGQDIEIATDSISLNKSEKTILMLTGDYDNPVVTPIVFERQDIDDLKIYFVNTSSKTFPLEVVIAETGADPISEDTVGIMPIQGTLTSDLMPIEDYTIYLKNADTGELIFESESIPLSYSIEYTLVVKDSFGPSDSKLSIDVITNSTIVDNYDDLDALAQYRVYNAEANHSNLKVEAIGKTPNTITSLGANELTDYFEVEFGDYQLKLTDENGDVLTQNKLLTLNQNESKTMVFYLDEEQEYNALSLTQSILPSSYQHEFNVLNLIDDFDSLQVYFIKDDETIESTSDFVKTLTFAKGKDYIITADQITILLVHEDSLGQKTLLARLDDINLNDSANLVLIANEASDTAGGYELQLLR